MARKPVAKPPERRKAAEPTEAVAIPTSSERCLAATCHGSIILFPLAVIPTAVIWAFKGHESKYVSFHSKQALWMQAALDVVSLVLLLVAALLHGVPSLGGLFWWVLRIALWVMWLGALYYGILAATKVAQGEDFRYPIISDLVGS